MEAMEMGQSTISVRLDDTIKKQFDSLCAEFGMSASTAFNIYARTGVLKSGYYCGEGGMNCRHGEGYIYKMI